MHSDGQQAAGLLSAYRLELSKYYPMNKVLLSGDEFAAHICVRSTRHDHRLVPSTYRSGYFCAAVLMIMRRTRNTAACSAPSERSPDHTSPPTFVLLCCFFLSDPKVTSPQLPGPPRYSIHLETYWPRCRSQRFGRHGTRGAADFMRGYGRCCEEIEAMRQLDDAYEINLADGY